MKKVYSFFLSFLSVLYFFPFLVFNIMWQASRAMKVYQIFFPFLSFFLISFFFILLCHCKLFYGIFVFFLIVLFGAIAFFWGVFVTCCIVQCNFISFYNCVTLLVEYQNNFLVLVVLFNHYFSFFWFCGFFGAFT